MEVHVLEAEKQVEVWLTRQERGDPVVEAHLKQLYQLGKERKWLVAVFLSGQDDLYQLSSALLCHNRNKLARLEIQQQRQPVGENI